MSPWAAWVARVAPHDARRPNSRTGSFRTLQGWTTSDPGRCATSWSTGSADSARSCGSRHRAGRSPWRVPAPHRAETEVPPTTDPPPSTRPGGQTPSGLGARSDGARAMCRTELAGPRYRPRSAADPIGFYSVAIGPLLMTHPMLAQVRCGGVHGLPQGGKSAACPLVLSWVVAGVSTHDLFLSLLSVKAAEKPTSRKTCSRDTNAGPGRGAQRSIP